MALFGIKRIQYCKATQLAFSGQNNPFLGIASEPTNTFTDIVCLVNSRATLTIEQTVQNKQIVFTAKLQFVTPADPALDVDHYAFIATTNDGERILLGANTRPQVAVVTAQGIYGTSGELTAYTTTAEFKANYRPLRLPVTAAEPVSGPAYDICCGQIPQPTAPDTREFDICCGEIVGEIAPTLLTVRWLNGDGSLLDSKTYYSNQPEPTTTAVPTKAATSEYSYVFEYWQVQSIIGTVKTYEPVFTETLELWCIITAEGPRASSVVQINYPDTNEEYNRSGETRPAGKLYLITDYGGVINYGGYMLLSQNADWNVITADWGNYFERVTDRTPVYDTNNPNLIIGYKKNNYTGEVPLPQPPAS